jgi:hypothetical protein
MAYQISETLFQEMAHLTAINGPKIYFLGKDLEMFDDFRWYTFSVPCIEGPMKMIPEPSQDLSVMDLGANRLFRLGRKLISDAGPSYERPRPQYFKMREEQPKMVEAE